MKFHLASDRLGINATLTQRDKPLFHGGMLLAAIASEASGDEIACIVRAT